MSKETDKELLELAAKSAGYDVKPHQNHAVSSNLVFIFKGKNWNPLTDDGDALRLAVKLNLSICTGPCQSSATSIDGALYGFFPKEDSIYQCQYAATRRAIVRAAAAIGEKL